MNEMMKRRTALLLCIVTAIAACVITYLLVSDSYGGNAGLNRKLTEIKALFNQKYVGEYNAKQLEDYAAAGYVTGFGDRWSSYLSKEDLANYQLSINGQMVGIGVSVAENEEGTALSLIDVYEGSPAQEAGLVIGDEISAADGVTLTEDGYTALVSAVRGEAGTDVTITVKHGISGATEDLTITRAQVDKVSVRGQMLGGNIGYIKISDFDQGVETQFATVLQDLQDKGAKALVFDVRYNPGGAVVTMSDILDRLLPEGKIISLKPKDGQGEETTYSSKAGEIDLPMAVLVNENSISAAEFFAAALQEYGKATIVGEKTIGKGYSQRTYELSDGSGLLLSDQKYYTPNGKNLAGVGITPDQVVPLSADKTARFYFLKPEEDDQLVAAVKAVGGTLTADTAAAGTTAQTDADAAQPAA